jgi:sulfite reductase (ferredoxin)
MHYGSSTVGACGDVNRNVMCSPAPYTSTDYFYARQYAKILAELFKPQSNALVELWENTEKVADMEYWKRELLQQGVEVEAAMLKDNGRGIIVADPVEPLYGQKYLPRKFKIAITVPGNNNHNNHSHHNIIISHIWDDYHSYIIV